MIKINLALKKQSVATNQPDSGQSKSAENLSAKLSSYLETLKRYVNPELLKDARIRKFLLVVVVCLLANFSLNSYEASEIQKLEAILTKTNADNVKLASEVAKTKGYEAIKKQIDTDEQILRTKLDTIKKLIADRQTPPKILLALSRDIPSQLWLSSCTLNDKEIKLMGSSVGYADITEFLRSLGESELLTDVKLVSSKTDKNSNPGIDVQDFELSAKRK